MDQDTETTLSALLSTRGSLKNKKKY